MSGWLAMSSDTSGDQFGKDTKWHNTTTCSSVDFASEASMLIWSYSSRYGDSCLHFSECINVDYSDIEVFLVTRRWGRHADGGTIVIQRTFWATQGNNALGLVWSSPGSWPG